MSDSEMMVKFLAGDRQAGRLIGSYGSTVAQIQNQAGSSVKVSSAGQFFNGTSDRVGCIIGDRKAVRESLKHMLQLIGWSSQEGPSLQLVVHGQAIPQLIGNNGENVKTVICEPSAIVRISPRIEGTVERVIKILCKEGASKLLTAVMSLLDFLFEGGYLRVPNGGNGEPMNISLAPDDAKKVVVREFNSSGVVGLHCVSIPSDEIKIDPDQLVGKVQEVEEFVCRTCYSSVVGCAPKLTLCSHMFCGDCLAQWFDVQPNFRSWVQIAKTKNTDRVVPCPVCKTALREKQDVYLLCQLSPKDEARVLHDTLQRLRTRCHNHSDFNPEGSCPWVGEYREYQNHARSCTRNKSGKPIEIEGRNAGHLEECLAVCNFHRQDREHQLIQVKLGDRVAVLEHPISGDALSLGWVYGKNLTQARNVDATNPSGSLFPGWFPKYCLPVKFCGDGSIDLRLYNAIGGKGRKAYDETLPCEMVACRDFSTNEIQGNAEEVDRATVISVEGGEVLKVHQRCNQWALVALPDALRVGWLPENILRKRTPEDSDDTVRLPASLRTFQVRCEWHGTQQGCLSVYGGNVVTVEIERSTGWTLVVISDDGRKKKGWLPDWVIDRNTDSLDYSQAKQVLAAVRTQLALGTAN